jgi:hypothetical protein
MMRRRTDPTLVYAIFTAILLMGAAGAFIADQSIQPQLDAYRGDPHCRGTLVSADTAGGACVTYRSSVADRWSTYSGRTQYYSVSVKRPDGGIDSVDLAGSRKRTVWNAATPGTPIVVERFTAPGAHPRVTAIALNGIRYQTLWNPEYRAGGDVFAIVLFVLAAPLFAWLTRRSWTRRRANEMVVHETYSSYSVTIRRR